MKNFTFLSPAVVVGAIVAAFVAVVDLHPTSAYVLVGVAGFFVLLGGALHDLGVTRKRRKVVKVHQAAVRAEEWHGPKPRMLRFGIKTLDENRAITNQPMRMTARRAGVEILLPKKGYQRVKVLGVGHFADPMPKQLA